MLGRLHTMQEPAQSPWWSTSGMAAFLCLSGEGGSGKTELRCRETATGNTDPLISQQVVAEAHTDRLTDRLTDGLQGSHCLAMSPQHASVKCPECYQG